jgi:hypothetical protein
LQVLRTTQSKGKKGNYVAVKDGENGVLTGRVYEDFPFSKDILEEIDSKA